jgi:hypothetical protein
MTPSSQEQKNHASWKHKCQEEGNWDEICDPDEYLRHEVLPTTKPHLWEGLKVAIYDGMGLLEGDDICLNTWGEDEEEAYSDADDDDGSENDGEMVDMSQETLEEDLKWLISKRKLPPTATIEDAQKYKAAQSLTAAKSMTATKKPSKDKKKKVSAPPAPTGTKPTPAKEPSTSMTATKKPSKDKKRKVPAPPAPTGTNDTPAKEPATKKKKVSTKPKKQLQLVKETLPKKAKKKVDKNEDSDFDPADDDEDFPDYDAGDDEDDDDLPPTNARPKGKGNKKSGGGKSKRRPAGAPPMSVENQLDHCVREKFLGVKNLMQSVQIMSTPHTVSDYYVAPTKPSVEEKELVMNESHFPRVIFGAYVLTAQKPNISGSAASSGPCLLIPKLHMWVGCQENIKVLTKVLKPLNKKKLELVLHVTFEELFAGAFGHDPLDTKRKRKEITPLLQAQPKGSKRKANTPPKTMTQMIDNHVRDKLLGIQNPMLTAQKMSTPLTLSDEWATAKEGVQLSEEEATRKVNEHGYPFVSIGAFCYTEMKGVNKKGGSNSSGTRLLEPKLHFWANSIHHAIILRGLLKPMEKKNTKATPVVPPKFEMKNTKAIPVVHPKFEDFYEHIFGVPPLNYSRERKQVVQKVPGAAAVKQEEAPIEQPTAKKEEAKKTKPKKRVTPIKVENNGPNEEGEGREYAIL